MLNKSQAQAHSPDVACMVRHAAPINTVDTQAHSPEVACVTKHSAFITTLRTDQWCRRPMSPDCCRPAAFRCVSYWCIPGCGTPAKLICGNRADAAFSAEPAPAGVATEDEVPFCVDWGTAPPSGAGESTIAAVDTGDGTPVTPGEVVTVGVTSGVTADVITAGSCCEELLAAVGVVLVAGAKLICGSRAGWMVA